MNKHYIGPKMPPKLLDREPAGGSHVLANLLAETWDSQFQRHEATREIVDNTHETYYSFENGAFLLVMALGPTPETAEPMHVQLTGSSDKGEAEEQMAQFDQMLATLNRWADAMPGGMPSGVESGFIL